MSSWLIDETGHAWREGTIELERHLNPLRGAVAASAFLVINAGFVRATTRGRIVTAEFARDGVHPNALIGLLRQLSELQPDAVAITYAGEGLPATIYRSRQAWLNYIGSLVTYHKAAEIRIRRQTPVAMSPFFSRHAAAEEIVRSVADPSVRNIILDRLFQGMYMLAQLDRKLGVARVMAMGSETQSYNPKAMPTAIGRSVAETFECSYGDWVMQHYLDVMAQQTPFADDVDATITLNGKSPRLLRYSRLTIPIEAATAEPWVLSVTVKR